MEMCAEGYFQKRESSCFSALSNHRPVTSAGSFQSREVPKDNHSQNGVLPFECVALKGGSAAAEKPIAGFLFPALICIPLSFSFPKLSFPLPLCQEKIANKFQAGGSISLRHESSMIKTGTLRLLTSLLCIL